MNNNFMRSGNNNNRNNNNRNRNNNNNRNRKFSSGSSNNSGGNSANKVFDSNGPDVKVRGTAQTVAEKYMQLGRDAQSSGDNVAAETYYQHAEHYYRLWAANQPVGQSLIMSKKFGEEEFQDEEGQPQSDEQGDDETSEQPTAQAEGVAAEASEHGEPSAEQPREQRPPRNDRNRERFRPRWQNRRDQPQDGQNGDAPQALAEGAAPAIDNGQNEQVRDVPVSESGWEAPSFLQRPTPIVTEEAAAPSPEAPERKPRQRKPRAEAAPAPTPETSATEE